MVTNKRTFIPGNEWLYYKIYTGVKTADMILTEIIKPVTEHLLADKLINQWFFIRYADPHSHLRLRFHISDPGKLGDIIHYFNHFIKPLIDQNIIWKIQTDTYQREIERYGLSTIHLAEELFYHDSTLITNTLDLIEGVEGEKIRWLFSLRMMDELLDGFNYSLEEKMKLLNHLAMGFGKEFGINSGLIKQLSNKYRNEKKEISTVLNRNLDKDNEMLPLFELLNTKSELSQKAIAGILNAKTKNELNIPLDNLLGSLIHMMLNRLFRSKQRLHEMVLYGFLFRYYKSEIAKLKYQKKQFVPV